ncbi:ABC transporter ATP-binding protein [Virgibacillus salexigens]|uniref:ABC transporter ATP-binding protein n=1 Tax=Virgibacillus salexigens TaxID=61016 RepID=UPI00190D6A2A|nr:ATP-binding cassette domain-containing protein [Virgibacillus salexigens]
MLQVENLKVNAILEMDQVKIEANKVTCIIGKSGSGKSTFLRLLNQLTSPDEGNIYFKEQDITELDPIQLRRMITMVPQTPIIFPGTVRDNLLVGQTLSGMDPTTDSQLMQVLNRMFLNKSLDMPADDLSGGEKQRLALARAMLLSAEVFLLDEPSSALDNTTATEVIDAFTAFVKESNKTMVMITHDLQLAERIADATIDMNQYSLSLDRKEYSNE